MGFNIITFFLFFSYISKKDLWEKRLTDISIILTYLFFFIQIISKEGGETAFYTLFIFLILFRYFDSIFKLSRETHIVYLLTLTGIVPVFFMDLRVGIFLEHKRVFGPIIFAIEMFFLLLLSLNYLKNFIAEKEKNE